MLVTSGYNLAFFFPLFLHRTGSRLLCSSAASSITAAKIATLLCLPMGAICSTGKPFFT